LRALTDVASAPDGSVLYGFDPDQGETHRSRRWEWPRLRAVAVPSTRRTSRLDTSLESYAAGPKPPLDGAAAATRRRRGPSP
jgi:hypothetical protein